MKKNENQKINNHTSIDKLRERKKKPQFIIEYLTEVSLTSTTNCGALKKGQSDKCTRIYRIPSLKVSEKNGKI